VDRPYHVGGSFKLWRATWWGSQRHVGTLAVSSPICRRTRETQEDRGEALVSFSARLSGHIGNGWPICLTQTAGPDFVWEFTPPLWKACACFAICMRVFRLHLGNGWHICLVQTAGPRPCLAICSHFVGGLRVFAYACACFVCTRVLGGIFV